MVMEASYFQLMEEHLHIEVWNSGGFFSLNTFLGYESLRLLDIASGPMQIPLNIYDKIERDGEAKQLKCSLHFKIVFEEYWDFMVNFIEWSSTNLEDRHKDKPG